MRRKISLYINNQLVDLDNDALVLLNFTQDDLNNPTIVKNSYSQSITLQGTPRNNVVFSHIYRTDFESGFSVLEKTPFVIFDDKGEILQKGYLKLNQMHRNGKYLQSYDITLFGGLGGFFYLLSSNEDGTPKNLADLYYRVFDDQWQDFVVEQPKDMVVGIGSKDGLTKETVSHAWTALENGYDGYNQLFNYVPCYNGYPACKFSANKAVFHEGTQYQTQYKMPNIYVTSGADSPDPDANGNILLEMENKHNEWEMQDLRSYLQRPAIRVKKFLEAIGLSQNIGDYKFVLDPKVFGNDDYAVYENSWITLPMFDRDNIDPYSDFTFDTFLRGTKTPADYLIGLAKMFGLVFHYEPTTNTITMMSKNEFYSAQLNDSIWEEKVDLTERIDIASVEVKSFVVDSRYLLFQLETKGAFADDYKVNHGRVYGSQRIDTGLAFNSDEKNLLEGIAYKGAVDVLETSPNYRLFGGGTSVDTEQYFFKFAFTEDVKWKLYQVQADGKLKATEYRPLPAGIPSIWYYNPDHPYADFLPRVQMHSADNKADDGADILVLFNGMRELPEYGGGLGGGYANIKMHLSDDTPEMLHLNNGEPCWDVALFGNNILPITKIPYFRRGIFAFGKVENQLDFGTPMEIATDEEVEANTNIYTRWWQKYIGDRYDVNAKVMTCKVDLSGMQVGENLLRQFYYFDGALWSLNAIRNHSLTTDDLTECEFVKVKDIDNYENGQLEI